MTDEEIVGSVQSMSKDTESDGEEETVSIKNVLESLDSVFNFLVHPQVLIAMQVLYQQYAPYENKC